jgi:DNA repair protein RAD16
MSPSSSHPLYSLLTSSHLFSPANHCPQDRSSSTAKAVFHLVSLNKWCLSGTPLQNRVGELYSLIRFLRVEPHAHYFCKGKGCNCKSLYYRFTQGRCDGCGHSNMQHFSHFNKHVLNPIKRSGYVGDGRKAMLHLKTQILVSDKQKLF